MRKNNRFHFAAPACAVAHRVTYDPLVDAAYLSLVGAHVRSEGGSR